MTMWHAPRWALCALLAAPGLPSALSAQFTEPPPPAAYVLQDVTVVGADGSRLRGVNVVVRGRLIEAIGSDIEPPPDARVLEGDSLLVYPGLIDAQGDAAYKFPEVEVDRNSYGSWNPPRSVQGFTPHRRIVDYLTADGGSLAEQRRKGLVAAAVQPSGRLMPGRGTFLLFRSDAAKPEDLVIQPVLGPLMSLQGAERVYPSTLFAVIAFYRQSFEDARHLAARMQAYERRPQGLTRPIWDPDLAILQDAMNGRATVYFAADNARDIRRVLKLSREYGFNPVIVGGDEAWKVADELKAADVPVLVALDFPKPERWKPDKSEKEEAEPGDDDGDSQSASSQSPDVDMDAGALREKQRIEDIYSNAGRLAAYGVSFALTSGGGKGDMLEGARKAIEYGLSETDALRALTLTPASLFGLEQLASLEAGMAATFIVLDTPLFSEDASVRYTFVEGELEEGKKSSASGEAPAVDVSGTWSVTMETSQGTFSSTWILNQEAASFTGTSQSQFGESRIVDGSVSAKDISFTLLFSLGDQNSEITFEGSVDGDSASGSGEGAIAGSFEWTAERTSGPEPEAPR